MRILAGLLAILTIGCAPIPNDAELPAEVEIVEEEIVEDESIFDDDAIDDYYLGLQHANKTLKKLHEQNRNTTR